MNQDPWHWAKMYIEEGFKEIADKIAKDLGIYNKRPDQDMTPEEWLNWWGVPTPALPKGWSVNKDGEIKWDPTPESDSNRYDALKCECGAESTYGTDTPFHASYCPKYKKP